MNSEPTPTVRLVRGAADDTELAAVIAVLHALAARRTATPPHPPAPARSRATWRHPARHPHTGWRAHP